METEKNKIEFWNSSDDIWEAVHDNCTNKKPLLGAGTTIVAAKRLSQGVLPLWETEVE